MLKGKEKNQNQYPLFEIDSYINLREVCLMKQKGIRNVTENSLVLCQIGGLA